MGREPAEIKISFQSIRDETCTTDKQRVAHQ